jgi:hypothetical protein
MTRVLVGIIANDSARYSLFSSCVSKLDTTGIECSIEWLIGGDWCGARNTLAQMCLDGALIVDEKGEPVIGGNGEQISVPYDYLWFMDDDHAFPPGLLKNLLRHGQPLMSPLCLARIAPFPLVTYAGMLPDGSRYLPLDLNGMGETGLVELEAGGCAGMLIRRDVLVATDKRGPGSEEESGGWFEYGDRSEDIVFCEKAKAAGYKLHADLECRLGHITTAVVWPAVNDGAWMTGVTVGRDLQLFVSPASEWEEVADEAAVDIQPPEAPPEVGLYDHPGIQPPAPLPTPLPREPERAEIWVDDDLRWWWRVIDQDGRIIQRESGIREDLVIERIQQLYPELDIHQVQREVDDSRDLNQYGPPRRIWDRGVT